MHHKIVKKNEKKTRKTSFIHTKTVQSSISFHCLLLGEQSKFTA